MNINPVSFGRTIKVNSSFSVAQHAADLINTIPLVRGEAKVQQQLKDIFYDTDKGRARAVAANGESGDVYIVSGMAGNDVGLLIKDRNFHIDEAKKTYGEDCYTYECIKEAEDERYTDLLTLVLFETEEPMELDIDYSKKKHRIKSIDIRI